MMTTAQEKAYTAEIQQYCIANKVKDGDERIIAAYQVTLGNGETLTVPNVKVSLYYCQQDDGSFQWEEAIGAPAWQRVEAVIRAKYPHYYSKYEVSGERFKVNLPVWRIGDYALKKDDEVAVIERMPGLVRILNTYFQQPLLVSEFDLKTHCKPSKPSKVTI